MMRRQWRVAASDQTTYSTDHVAQLSPPGKGLSPRARYRRGATNGRHILSAADCTAKKWRHSVILAAEALSVTGGRKAWRHTVILPAASVSARRR